MQGRALVISTDASALIWYQDPMLIKVIFR